MTVGFIILGILGVLVIAIAATGVAMEIKKRPAKNKQLYHVHVTFTMDLFNIETFREYERIRNETIARLQIQPEPATGFPWSNVKVLVGGEVEKLTEKEYLERLEYKKHEQ